jgi:hypothetical protein
MRTISRTLSVCWFLFFVSNFVLAQSAKKPPKHQPDCQGNCFTTQVISAKITGDCCTEYELRVSHDGTCRYDLSHFTVALPCGTIASLSNSRNWKQEIGKDPTTGLRGFKIDDIPSFGKDGKNSFTVNVKVCGDSSCLEKITTVAYKAGQCVDYQTLHYDVTGSCGTPPDTTKTCSTLTASISTKNISCFGANNGELRVQVQEGKAPFSYAWSTGATDSVLLNTSAGAYAVTVSDADGNVLTLNGTITSPPAITLSETVFNPSCSGSGNGFIDVTALGGSGSLTYLWNTGATTQDISNLNAGLYTLIITDSLGCSKQKSYMLVNNVRITLSGVITKASCGGTNGGVNVSITGGTAPYTYAWDNGATTEDLTNVPAGTYRITVTDANGCKGQSAFVVTENNTLRVTFTTISAGCFNEATGAIDVTVAGGTAPYTYSWQHGPTTEDISGLIGGIYRLTVTDNAGCSLLTPINVPKKSIQVNTQIIQPFCLGDSTGSIIITPVESGVYTYVWSTGDTTNTVTQLPIGTYAVTITDASGCSRTLSYNISQPIPVSLSSTTSNNQCGTEGSFAIDLVVTGGKAPYTYQWSNGAATQDLQNLNSGTYSVLVKDANACSASKTITIAPSSTSYDCTIAPAATSFVCGSAGNILNAAVADAQLYQWSVVSSDTSWVITSGASASSAIFMAGTSGSTATFSLTIQKDGCTKTCTYAVASGCTVRDNNGGGDPSSGDPCDSTVVVPPQEPDPEEPPTEEPESCYSFSVYPNPFVRNVTIEWVADKNDRVKVVIVDACGRVVARLFDGNVIKCEKYTVEWDTEGRARESLYFYRIISSTHTEQGKLFRKPSH